jgi:hypothetical protein
LDIEINAFKLGQNYGTNYHPNACKTFMQTSAGGGRLGRWENNFKLELIKDCVE